uniref:Predicted gene 11060 n=1 Tax=Mus spicilegus TaxID=10103 RepID=A0A8C6H5Z2_MUSSI
VCLSVCLSVLCVSQIWGPGTHC